MKNILAAIVLGLLPVVAMAEESAKLPAPGDWALQQLADRDRTILGLLVRIQELQTENSKLKEGNIPHKEGK